MEVTSKHTYSVESIRGFLSHTDNTAFNRQVLEDLLAHYDTLHEAFLEAKVQSVDCASRDSVLLQNCILGHGHEGKHSDSQGREF